MDRSSPSAALPDRPRIRRGHRKTRTGCGICKRRKIKCDEGRPGCANCHKHGVQCSYPRKDPEASPLSPNITVTSAPTPDHLPSQPSNDSYHRGRSAPALDIPTQSPGTGADLSGAGPSGRIPRLEMIHLELLHNYTTLTSQTLSEDPVLKNVWRINVVEVAFAHDFVMRAIFAISALHIALYAGADRRAFYLDVARSEHGAALRDITHMLPRGTAANCSAIYIAAALTFFYSWAAPRHPGETFLVSAEGGVADWWFLLKGVRAICDTWRDDLDSGPFSPMFRLGGLRQAQIAGDYIESAAWLTAPEHAQLSKVKQVVRERAPDAATAAVYEQSVVHLELCFCSVFGAASYRTEGAGREAVAHRGFLSQGVTSNVYSWLYRISSEFIDLLVRRDPLALIVFAHFCVSLKFLGSFWWMQGWSTHLMQEIWDMLDEEHRLWIRWPIEELGWRPKV